MTEPTEYPIPLPVTPKMADRMRAAGWRPCRHDDTVDDCNYATANGTRTCQDCGATVTLTLVTHVVNDWVQAEPWGHA